MAQAVLICVLAALRKYAGGVQAQTIDGVSYRIPTATDHRLIGAGGADTYNGGDDGVLFGGPDRRKISRKLKTVLML